MTDDEARRVAMGLTKAQRDCLLLLPCSLDTYLPSASFHMTGLSKIRRRFWVIGPLWNVLTPLGLAVRTILQEPTDAHNEAS